MAVLQSHDWPGNVRQLRNVVRQLCISSRGLDRARVDSRLAQMLATGAPAPGATDAGTGEAQLTDDDLVAALRAHGHRIGATAAALGISRSALYNRVKGSTRIRQAKDLSAEEIAESRERCGGDLALMARDLEVSRRALGIRLRDLSPASDDAEP
jgi:two-component system nitrogen regulation response regulator GlnG